MVPAFLALSTNRYREVFGLDFEDFAPGQVFRHRPGITLSQQDNRDEATDTLNNAMLHYDAAYAAASEWDRPLGVSTMTLQTVIGSAWKTFYRRRRIRVFREIAMTAPVFGGDTLYGQSRIVAIDPAGGDEAAGLVEIETEAHNQDGVVVARIGYQAEIFRRGCCPDHGPLGGSSNGSANGRHQAYHTAADGALVEQSGLFFEDLAVGEAYEHRPGKTLHAFDVWRHATASLDWHPRFVDQNSEGRMPVPEAYALSVATALTTRTFGRVVANLAWRDAEMLALTHIGDTLYSASEIVGKRESRSRPDQGVVTVSTTASNQHGDPVIRFNRTLLVYRRGCGPYEQAGY